ncbi:Hydrolase YhcX [Rhodospirillaceae bacterium LM-1]|nr:Hydrolase YhcX [Rhodospirillaceae bacterium LM-1]
MHKSKKKQKGDLAKRVRALKPPTSATLINELPKKAGRKKRSHKLVLRHLTLDDYEDLKAIMDRVYANMGGAWTKEHIASQLAHFPEGQICIENKGRVIAVALSLIVKYADWGDKHTYAEITADGFITTHNPQGDTLYGVDLFVDPDFRDLRLGRRLYDARKEMCESMNLRAIVAGGRIPGYKDYAGKMTPRQYIELVKNKELHDPVLSFQLANDFHVRRVITDYEPLDRETRGYATLLEWINIYYEDKPVVSSVGQAKEVVRIGAVQWQMRPVESFEGLMRQIEFFVDAVAGYKADFMLLPEFFGAPLMALADTSDPALAVRHLAEYGPSMRQELQRLAVSYNVNIIAGSMPEYRDMELRNVSYLMRRDGTSDAQYKLHITPDEKAYWGVKGGDALRVFNTDIGRIGILICYDVEFPELPRLLAEQGMSILFVPYWTDTKNAYLRLRHCAQARAIENECYVVITGSVGNLPNVENMDIQYSQAAILTPSDFSFPHDGVAAEATPNTETVLIADLDLSLLKELHMHGSVRNLMDRRLDLYDLSLQK